MKPTLRLRRLSIDKAIQDLDATQLRSVADACTQAASQLEHVAEFFDVLRGVANERVRQAEPDLLGIGAAPHPVPSSVPLPGEMSGDDRG